MLTRLALWIAIALATVVARASPTTGPTARPDPGATDDPKHLVKSFFTAINHGNHAAAKSCWIIDGYSANYLDELIDAYIDYLSASAHVQREIDRQLPGATLELDVGGRVARIDTLASGTLTTQETKGEFRWGPASGEAFPLRKTEAGWRFSADAWHTAHHSAIANTFLRSRWFARVFNGVADDLAVGRIKTKDDMHRIAEQRFEEIVAEAKRMAATRSTQQ
jgi:hypothetical protein